MTGTLYVFGGEDAQGKLVDDVFVAPILPDGSLGAWLLAAHLPLPRHYEAGNATPDRLYIFGGETTNGFQADTLVSVPVDGGLGAFTPSTSFSTVRFRHASVLSVDRVYVLGGYNTTGPLSDVQQTLINADGSLGAWSTGRALPTPRHRHAAATYNGYVYVLGGSTDSGIAYTNLVTMASIGANADLGVWQDVTPFVTERDLLCGLASNGRVYVIGGLSGSGFSLDDVQVATMNVNDGTLGNWAQTSSFSTGRSAHACALFNNRIYIIGGVSQAAKLADVQYADIQADGTLGTWKTTTSLPAPRAFTLAEAH